MADSPQRSPDARPAVLYPFIGAWILYGIAIAARFLGDPSNSLWESVQRYAFIAALGFLARYKSGGLTTWIPIALAILAIGAVVIEGNDPAAAALLAGVFAAAMGVGQLLRRRS